MKVIDYALYSSLALMTKGSFLPCFLLHDLDPVTCAIMQKLRRHSPDVIERTIIETLAASCLIDSYIAQTSPCGTSTCGQENSIGSSIVASAKTTSISEGFCVSPLFCNTRRCGE